MTIIEWFQPNDVEHIRAYKHLMDTGIWPMEVVPKELYWDTSFWPNCWQIGLAAKMADNWVSHILNLNGGI